MDLGKSVLISEGHQGRQSRKGLLWQHAQNFLGAFSIRRAARCSDAARTQIRRSAAQQDTHSPQTTSVWGMRRTSAEQHVAPWAGTDWPQTSVSEERSGVWLREGTLTPSQDCWVGIYGWHVEGWGM